MRIARSTEEAEAAKFVALGVFDGVHVGHQELVKRLVGKAESLQGNAAVITFDPHPLEVLSPGHVPPYLTALEEKARLLEDLGVHEMLVLSFDRAFAALSPEVFVKRVFGVLLPKYVTVGYNFSFGHKGMGTCDTLKDLGIRHGFEVEVVNPVMRGGMVVSSTLIRKVIHSGKMRMAKQMLGRAYSLPAMLGEANSGIHDLVFDTRRALPGNGVYAVKVESAQTTAGAKGAVIVKWPGPKIGLKFLGATGEIQGEVSLTFVERRKEGEEGHDGLDQQSLRWAGATLEDEESSQSGSPGKEAQCGLEEAGVEPVL